MGVWVCVGFVSFWLLLDVEVFGGRQDFYSTCLETERLRYCEVGLRCLFAIFSHWSLDSRERKIEQGMFGGLISLRKRSATGFSVNVFLVLLLFFII